MNVLIERYHLGSEATIGKLFVDGNLVCYTLEDTVRPAKIKGITAIPEGKYKVSLRYSPKFSPKYKHDMLWVKDVPNYEFILIHPGNTAVDTMGCLLVGSSVSANMKSVTESRKAYDKLYKILAPEAKAGNLTITYKNSAK